jgi:hypothetical protein
MLYSKQMLLDMAMFISKTEIRIQLLKIGRRHGWFKALGVTTVWP